MIYDLISGSNPFLKQATAEFDFKNPPIDPLELATNLLETMNHHRGMGLAANQCGLPYRCFVMIGEPNFACFNPKIVMSSEETILLEEGCLSFKNLIVKVKRPKLIRCRFTGVDGKTYTKVFTGMTARIFQHELDHLEGKLFYDQANRVHRDMALKKWRRKAA